MVSTIRSLSKFNTILLAAALMTFTLFYSMQLLIQGDGAMPQRLPSIKIGPITEPELDIEVIRTTPKPDLPDDIVAPPEIVITEGGEGPPINVPNEFPTNPGGFQDPVTNFGPMDARAMAIAQVQPVYPTNALERGIEGFVILQFDVSENGTVINPEVLAADPPRVFDRAALRAIERWKYQPMVENGKAVKMRGLQTRFAFTIEE